MVDLQDLPIALFCGCCGAEIYVGSPWAVEGGRCCCLRCTLQLRRLLLRDRQPEEGED